MKGLPRQGEQQEHRCRNEIGLIGLVELERADLIGLTKENEIRKMVLSAEM